MNKFSNIRLEVELNQVNKKLMVIKFLPDSVNIYVNARVERQFLNQLPSELVNEYTKTVESMEDIANSDRINDVDINVINYLKQGLVEKFKLVEIEEKPEVVKKKIKFDDIIGMVDVKDKLHDVIDQFENTEKYIEWNIKPINGILLYGPSGTGKSFISEALANEVDAKFMKISSADVMSKYIGESGKNVKKIFDKARKSKRAIVFIDEIDFLASKRDDENKERNAALNELLVQMASPNNDNIFLIFATNMKDLLDPAFLRSGRCDFKIEVSLPDFEARKGILELCSKGRPLSEDVDFDKISRNMSGMNCADMTHVSNESARRALKNKREEILQEDFDIVLEEMICGTNNGSKSVSGDEKKIVAIHETGHLIANEFYELNKTKKISILPRGSALGFVLHVNEDKDDKYLYTENELLTRIKVCLAGRAAEEIVFGNATTGASNDLEKATSIAEELISRYGYNEEIGLVSLKKNEIFMRNKINRMIKELLDTEYTLVKNLMKYQFETLNKFAEILCDKEEMNGDEIHDILYDELNFIESRKLIAKCN